MTRCARCHRVLLREPVSVAGMQMGPKCAAAVTGGKPKRGRIFELQNPRPPRGDVRQRDLFVEATP